MPVVPGRRATADLQAEGTAIVAAMPQSPRPGSTGACGIS